MSEFGYIPEAPEQSFGNNKGIFNPKDIYDLTRADKYTNYGQLELIETQTVSSVAQVDFTNLGTYNVHFMTINDMAIATDNQLIDIRFFESGVLESGSVYQSAGVLGASTGSFSEERSTSATFYRWTGGIGNATNETGNGYCYFYNLIDSSKYSFLTSHTQFQNSSNVSHTYFGSGVLPQASEVSGIRILSNSGNIDNADISLYGIKEYS